MYSFYIIHIHWCTRPLSCLFFNLRLLITPLVSSSLSENGAYSNVTVGQSFTIHSASMDNIGFYICYVTHKNDSSRISTIAMTIYVKGKSHSRDLQISIKQYYPVHLSYKKNMYSFYIIHIHLYIDVQGLCLVYSSIYGF
jgi:hypothetical protein